MDVMGWVERDGQDGMKGTRWDKRGGRNKMRWIEWIGWKEQDGMNEMEGVINNATR